MLHQFCLKHLESPMGFTFGIRVTPDINILWLLITKTYENYIHQMNKTSSSCAGCIFQPTVKRREASKAPAACWSFRNPHEVDRWFVPERNCLGRTKLHQVFCAWQLVLIPPKIIQNPSISKPWCPRSLVKMSPSQIQRLGYSCICSKINHFMLQMVHSRACCLVTLLSFISFHLLETGEKHDRQGWSPMVKWMKQL